MVKENYILIHRDTAKGIRRATYLAAILSAIATITLLAIFYCSADALLNIRSCGNGALASYERAREMDRMPVRNKNEIRRAIEGAK